MKKYYYAGLAASIVLALVWLSGYDFNGRGILALLIGWCVFCAGGVAFLIGMMEELP